VPFTLIHSRTFAIVNDLEISIFTQAKSYKIVEGRSRDPQSQCLFLGNFDLYKTSVGRLKVVSFTITIYFYKAKMCFCVCFANVTNKLAVESEIPFWEIGVEFFSSTLKGFYSNA